MAHFDFLSRTLPTHGLPLALSVDYHSFFYTHNPDAFTQLGAARHCCGIQLRSAPTPQAKGKIERRHDDGQKRLVPLLAAARIRELTGANPILDQLFPHASAIGEENARRQPISPFRCAWPQMRFVSDNFTGGV